MIQYDVFFYVFCSIMCLYVYLVFAGVVKDKFQPWLIIKMYYYYIPKCNYLNLGRPFCIYIYIYIFFYKVDV